MSATTTTTKPAQASRPATPPIIGYCTDVADMIFVDIKTKKKGRKAQVATTTTSLTAANLDITKWSAGDQRMLVSSTRVQILGDQVVATVSKYLLRATSETVAKILEDGKVQLSADTNINGVVQLLNWLEAITWGPMKPLNRGMSMETSLNVCAAGELLGMHKYIDDLYKPCEAELRNNPPAYEDLNGIVAVRPRRTAYIRL
jgi:hypothetical protein